jgi:uncharacterized membrane protein
MADFHKGPLVDISPEGFAGLLVVIFALFTPFAIIGDAHSDVLTVIMLACVAIASIGYVYSAYREKKRLQLMFPEIYGEPELSEEEKRSERRKKLVKILLFAFVWLASMSFFYLPNLLTISSKLADELLSALAIAAITWVAVYWLKRRKKAE